MLTAVRMEESELKCVCGGGALCKTPTLGDFSPLNTTQRTTVPWLVLSPEIGQWEN